MRIKSLHKEIILLSIVVVVWIGFFALTSNKNVKGVIRTDRRDNYFTEIIKEENGCIYYKTECGKEVKTCGSYTVYNDK